MTSIAWLVLALILVKALTQLGLAHLNRRHVLANADEVPEPFRGRIAPETYAKSVAYTLAKVRLQRFEIVWNSVVLALALFSGVLPAAWSAFIRGTGASTMAEAGFLFLAGMALNVCGWPLDWYGQFRLEQRFGFNTMTARTWWLDRVKGLALALLLGYPLLWLLVKLAEWTGRGWWIWVWGALVLFETLVLVLAPVLLLPLFNRFAPLPEGPLRQRLLALAERTGFRARSIQVMDGSKRSRHSNAFFTGLGRFRKIVLYDTLIEQLEEVELAAVLAHEIGHYRLKHVLQMLGAALAGLLAGCWLLGWLADAPWFYAAFGFAPGNRAVAFLLFGLLAGTVTFWITPVASLWSRRCEYQADAFAAEAMGEPGSLTSALRKLNEQNLSNLTPHPLYSAVYYSHPTLLERERALAARARGPA